MGYMMSNVEDIRNEFKKLKCLKEVKDFLLEKYNEWQTNGYTHQEVKNKAQFTRQQEAEEFEKLFLECIK